MKETNAMQALVESFVKAANAFDIDKATSLFSSEAVIDDVSVGDEFVGHGGVRLYLDRFFVGYNTASKLLRIDVIDNIHCIVRLDFTGDFGHEIGTLRIRVSSNDLIERIDADLD